MGRLVSAYFSWVCGLVGHGAYGKLLSLLFGTDFVYILDMDGNRESDGLGLRRRFGIEEDVDMRDIAGALGSKPCSVLEMMAALCLRMEEQVMGDPDEGCRTGEWFHGMLESLGLAGMDDRGFDQGKAERILRRFMERRHSPDGRGSLFTLRHPRADMRDVEIWYQMMWHFTEMHGE